MLSLTVVARRMFGKFRWIAAISPATPNRGRTILDLGMLEDRTVPDTFRYVPGGANAWNNVANWFNGTTRCRRSSGSRRW